MRALKQFAIACCVIALVSCKTQRPTVDINDGDYAEDTTLKSMDGTENVRSILKVSALSFPPSAVPYTRVSIKLEASGQSTIELENYSLKAEIPIQSGIKYSLTVVVYKAGHPIYSNAYCQNSNRFTAKAGSNNYTVPMCLIPSVTSPQLLEKDDNDGESDMMIETPSAPGES